MLYRSHWPWDCLGVNSLRRISHASRGTATVAPYHFPSCIGLRASTPGCLGADAAGSAVIPCGDTLQAQWGPVTLLAEIVPDAQEEEHQHDDAPLNGWQYRQCVFKPVGDESEYRLRVEAWDIFPTTRAVIADILDQDDNLLARYRWAHPYTNVSGVTALSSPTANCFGTLLARDGDDETFPDSLTLRSWP